MRKEACLWAACLVVSLCLAGCFKTKEDFTLNPDGSGKVTYEVARAHNPQAPADPALLQEEARKEAAKIVKESQGVTAWKDVTFAADKDGRIIFKGTAYFPDIAKLKFVGNAKLNTTVKYTPAAGDAAQLELTLMMQKEPTPAEAPKLTEEQITKEIADAKKAMAQQLPMFAKVLPEFQAEWTFTLPGQVEKCVNLQPVAGAPNTVRLLADGKKMLDFMKAMSEDEAAMRAKIVAGKNPIGPPEPDVLNEKLFGTKGPITVAFKPGDKPLFDFAAESEAAKKAMPEMQKSLEAQVPAAK